MGADIRPADDTAGPRAGAYTLNDPGELPPVDISASADAARLLRASSALRDGGWRVVYQLSGPISIFSCMTPLSCLFKYWRKTPETVGASLDRLQDMLSRFTAVLCEAGVEYISYSDPAGNANILGPKYGSLLTERFTLTFLKRIRETCGDRCSLLICPMTAASLSSGGHLLAAAPDGGDIAACCVKREGCMKSKNFKLR